MESVEYVRGKGWQQERLIIGVPACQTPYQSAQGLRLVACNRYNLRVAQRGSRAAQGASPVRIQGRF